MGYSQDFTLSFRLVQAEIESSNHNIQFDFNLYKLSQSTFKQFVIANFDNLSKKCKKKQKNKQKTNKTKKEKKKTRHISIDV